MLASLIEKWLKDYEKPVFWILSKMKVTDILIEDMGLIKKYDKKKKTNIIIK